MTGGVRWVWTNFSRFDWLSWGPRAMAPSMVPGDITCGAVSWDSRSTRLFLFRLMTHSGASRIVLFPSSDLGLGHLALVSQGQGQRSRRVRSMMDLPTIKAAVKSWEKSFKAAHGRDPTKDDIKKDPGGIGELRSGFQHRDPAQVTHALSSQPSNMPDIASCPNPLASLIVTPLPPQPKTPVNRTASRPIPHPGSFPRMSIQQPRPRPRDVRAASQLLKAKARQARLG